MSIHVKCGGEKTRPEAGSIHQSIPLNGVASISITIQVLEATKDIMEMITIMEGKEGIHKVHITGRSASF